jgi:hypothetical protein
MIKPNQTIIIYFNEEYPFGYTTCSNQKESNEVAMALVETTKKSWSVVSGAKHWKTGKPAYYTVFTEEKTKDELVTNVIL